MSAPKPKIKKIHASDKLPEAARTMTGAEMVVKAMVAEGTDTIFGYPGGAVLPLYDAIFRQNELRHILVRHEQAATHAAEGYARSTGKVGAVLVTSGPGATNAVTGLTDAMMDSIPLVCITGQVPSHLIGSDAFQEADTTGITRACTKYNYLVKDVNDLGRIVHEAFHIARSGRPGPVVIDVPKNILNATGSYAGKAVERKSYQPRIMGDEKMVERAIELMASAKRPIFYVGGGLVNSGEEACETLRELVRLTGFPITQTLMGLGAFPGSDPQFLGMLGMHGSLEANMAMHGCDVMINLGARFDDRVTGKLEAFSPKSKKIHVDIDPSSINKNVRVQVPIVGDVGLVLKQMLTVWKKKFPAARRVVASGNRPSSPKAGSDAAVFSRSACEDWWKQIDGWRAKQSFSYHQPAKGVIKPQHALARLDKAMRGKDFYITTDVGQHQMWAAQYITYDKPHRWMTSGGLGTMGYGLPAAMGVQIAHPEKLVVCVSGEASVQMNIQELSTIKQYRLPVKLFILNNHYMGMVRQWQEMFHGGRYAESYCDSLPDFVMLAKSYGIAGLRCDKLSDVDDCIAEMIKIKGPVVVDMQVDQNENVYPMIPAGAAHNEIVLGAGDRNDGKLDKNQV